MKSTVIELKKVWRSYEMGSTVVHAVRGVDLKVQKGEFLAIIGKSGSGKSTIMNLIGCLDIPSKGMLFLDRKNTGEMAESDLAQIRGKKIGFVFQQFNLIPTLTALENVMLPGEFQDTSEDKLRKEAIKWLKFVDMERFMFKITKKVILKMN